MRIAKFLNIAKSEKAIDIYLNGEICSNDNKFMYDLFDIESTDPNSLAQQLKEAGEKPLTLHINSVGGDLFAGMSMYSLIKNYPGETTAIVDSICASAATLPMVACDKVVMQAPSTIMIHCAMMGTWGNKKELEKDIKALESLDNSIANAYEAKTGLDRKEILKLMEAETWLDSKKAKELGFADEIDGKLMSDKAVKILIDANKRLVACLRDLEHSEDAAPPKRDTAKTNDSKLCNGKYKSVAELEKAHAELQVKHTQKCQAYAELRKSVKAKTENKKEDIDEAVVRAKIAVAKAKIGLNKKEN